MNVEEWEEKFKPVPNHLDDNASWQDSDGNGIMFETYGDEYEYVEQFKLERRVWSYRDDEYEGLILVSGMAQNPIGYFITEVPWTDEDLNTIIYVEEKDETV